MAHPNIDGAVLKVLQNGPVAPLDLYKKVRRVGSEADVQAVLWRLIHNGTIEISPERKFRLKVAQQLAAI